MTVASDHYETFVRTVASHLDLDSGLAAAVQAGRYSETTGALSRILDLDRGLATLLPSEYSSLSRQSPTLGTAARRRLFDEKYDGIIASAVASAAGIAVPGIFLPMLDVVGVGTIWVTMIRSIARASGREIDNIPVQEIVAAGLNAVSSYLWGSRLLTLGIMCFANLPAAVALNIILNGVFTLKLAISTIDQFNREDFKDIAMEALPAVVAEGVATRPKIVEIQVVAKMIAAA